MKQLLTGFLLLIVATLGFAFSEDPAVPHMSLNAPSASASQGASTPITTPGSSVTFETQHCSGAGNQAGCLGMAVEKQLDVMPSFSFHHGQTPHTSS